MNNNQQQFQQQQPYQQRASFTNRFYGPVNSSLEKAIVVTSLIFFGLAAFFLVFGFLYSLIYSIVNDYTSFHTFVTLFESYIITTARFMLFGLVLAICKKKL